MRRCLATPMTFLASLLTHKSNERDFEHRFEQDFKLEFPVLMGLATKEEINLMTLDEIEYLNYKANELYKMQHPELEPEE